MEINSLNAETIRVTNFDINAKVIEAPISPNCGLSSYLVEAYIKAEYTKKGEDKLVTEVVNSLIKEAQTWDKFANKKFWGWEKEPSIGKKFPFDWDDTAKAIDCLRAADEYKKIAIDIDGLLPDKKSLNLIFSNSIFKSNYIGIDKKNAKVYCPYNKALLVFFGPDSEKYNDKERDDPMVTITAIRMLAQHYPNVINQNSKIIRSLLKRAIFTLNYILKYKSVRKRCIDFSEISRYYFSLGHFAYRLFETIEILNKNGFRLNNNKLAVNKLLKIKIQDSYNKLNEKNPHKDSDYIDHFWWYLLGLKIELITVQNDFQDKVEKLNEIPDRVVYQHRGLKHQYFSPGWEKQLLNMELQRHNLSIGKNNESNFAGLRYLKKSTLPIFALISFIIFIVGYWSNQTIIIDNFKIDEILFNNFPKLNIVLSIIFFMVIGLKLYLQAWAVEETYLTNRIITPIKNLFWKNIINYFELSFRFLWTLLIMLFPIFYSSKSQFISLPWMEPPGFHIAWHLYIAAIFILILFWDISLIIGFHKLYEKLGKNISKIKLHWFIFDFIIAFIAICLHFSLYFDWISELESWGDLIFFVLMGGITVLSGFQIYVFSSFIFYNKITYKYDS